MFSLRTFTLFVATAALLVSGCPTREHVVNLERETTGDILVSGGPPPKIILLIGDGMGLGQLEATSYFHSGRLESLSFYDLPVHGMLKTSSLSGTTDSAASATAMATGEFTYNGKVGLDEDGDPAQNLVELAKDYGLATGLVTTTRLTHATPAAFAAHVSSRGQYANIAEQMTALQPDVLLGGGRTDFEAENNGSSLRRDMQVSGYTYVTSASELENTLPDSSPQLLGIFADSHLPYRVDRSSDSDVPLLSHMTLAALDRLDSDPQGFFLMVEGGRIDHAGHSNNIERCIGETLDFDDTVSTVMRWADGRDDVTILVTADHETGGLQVVTPGSVGEISEVSWRWGSHTNANVDIFGQGPGSAVFDGDVLDHRWVHGALAGLIENRDRTVAD